MEMGDTDQTQALLTRASRGDAEALDALFLRHRERLVRMVRLRLGRQLGARVDASDVLQEAHLEAWHRLPSYLDDRERMPFFLWLRFLTGQKMAQLHRFHIGAQRRDARREVRAHGIPDADHDTIVRQLIGDQTSPSSGAERAERHAALLKALDEMDPMDRDGLTLRHFEHLTNVEAAVELGVSEAAASKRYIRALRKIGSELGARP
jgi:RNA polymerase sigma-70 factor (ECF subfamily)